MLNQVNINSCKELNKSIKKFKKTKLEYFINNYLINEHISKYGTFDNNSYIFKFDINKILEEEMPLDDFDCEDCIFFNSLKDFYKEKHFEVILDLKSNNKYVICEELLEDSWEEDYSGHGKEFGFLKVIFGGISNLMMKIILIHFYKTTPPIFSEGDISISELDNKTKKLIEKFNSRF